MADILRYYGTNLKISGPLHGIPLEWFSPSAPTYSDKLLRPINDRIKIRNLNKQSLLSMVTIFILMVQGVQSSNSDGDELNYQPVVLGLFLIILVMSTFQSVLCRLKTLALAELINGLIQFDRLYPKRQKKLREMSIYELFSLLMPKAGFSWQVTISIGTVFGLHWSNPWKITLAGYWLIPKEINSECQIISTIYFVICRIVVMMLNFWNWTFVVCAPAFVYVVIHTLSISAIIRNIEL